MLRQQRQPDHRREQLPLRLRRLEQGRPGQKLLQCGDCHLWPGCPASPCDGYRRVHGDRPLLQQRLAVAGDEGWVEHRDAECLEPGVCGWPGPEGSGYG